MPSVCKALTLFKQKRYNVMMGVAVPFSLHSLTRENTIVSTKNALALYGVLPHPVFMSLLIVMDSMIIVFSNPSTDTA
jgi:hypothetical protein